MSEPAPKLEREPLTPPPNRRESVIQKRLSLSDGGDGL